ncbi:MAG TPA: EVE domain-containing protein [Fimbriimonadaceae bacterium]|nr:EVE domain-containing protein [Fimbriimonadaceae bacterium]
MPERAYWLDLFTPETWAEIGKIDYAVSGYRANREAHAKKVRPGDLFLCYLTGKSRFVGILEVESEAYWDETPIWQSDAFPVRFKTRLVSRVPEDRGVHLHEVVEQSEHARSWSGYYRGSPQRLPHADGQFIATTLKSVEAEAGGQPPEAPVEIEIAGDESSAAADGSEREPKPERDHDRIQYRLLALGRDLGLELWVASNDRGRTYDDERFGDMAAKELPVRFDDATRRTIELIDVLWLSQNRIEAAFEIESTTSIFSGLLRMADLLALQPNIDIPLFIVAPDDRRKAVLREIRRPVFASLPTPLWKACRYIAFDRLESELDALGDRARYLRPEFINDLAEKAG